MFRLHHMLCVCFLAVTIVSTTAAQEGANSIVQRSSVIITATAIGDRIRITAPSSVVEMHVAVYAAGGERVFDQEIKGGNVFDWHLQDVQGQRLAPGTYVCVVTAKSISGKLTQKIGSVSIEEKSVSVQAAESPQLSAPQAQNIGPMEENSSWLIAEQDQPQTPTVIAHDGMDGQMIRGRGALTFRIGNFFTGKNLEQMRLTEAGNLGIGTSEPKAKLDVAGTIRAERFLVAKPNARGSNTLAGSSAQATDAADSVQPLASGIGTQGRIAKWTDNAGTLGDSAITETGGNVGIGTTTPGSKLVVSSNTATLPAASGVARFAAADGVQTSVFADAFGTNPIFNVRRANGTAASPSALQANQLLGVIGASGFGASAYSGTRARVAFLASENWTNTANGTFITFNTTANGAATAGGTERLRIDNDGNVGIGTTAPAAALDIQKDNSSALFLTEPTLLTTSYGANNFLGVDNLLVGRTAGGTRANPAAPGSGQSMMSLVGRGYNGTAFTASKAIIDLQTSEAWTATANGARIRLFTTDNGTTSLSQRMRIENDGSVGIGTTAPANPLHVVGPGTDSGGTPGSNTVVGHFKQATASQGTAVSIDANSNESSILILSEEGVRRWTITDRPNFLDILLVDSYDSFGTGHTRLSIQRDGSVRMDGSVNIQSSLTAAANFNLGDSGDLTIDDVTVPGHFYFTPYPGPTVIPSIDFVCINDVTTVLYKAGFCASSIRYKTNIQSFNAGLDLINRLRPVSFNWKSNSSADFGLVAEEVAKVEPLLVTHNDKGEIQGVNYDRIGVVLVNAVNELKAEKDEEISALKSESEVRNTQIGALKSKQVELRDQYSAIEARLSTLESKFRKNRAPDTRSTRLGKLRRR